MSEALNVEYLKPLYRDDPQALFLLVREAINESSALIDAIERLSKTQDEEAIDAAHRLKRLCRTTGANELASIAEEVEGGAKSGRWDEAVERIGPLRSAHRRFVEAATALRR